MAFDVSCGRRAQRTCAYFYIRSDVSATQQGLGIRVGGKIFGKCLSEILDSGTGTKGSLAKWRKGEEEEHSLSCSVSVFLSKPL